MSFEIALDWSDAFRLVFAFLITLPIAYNREKNSRVMGLRTYPLVSLGACGYIIIASHFIAADDAGSMARLMQGLLGGIGFLGGGAILKTDDRVTGTASAACIWITGAIGAASALGLYLLAITLVVITFISLNIFSTVKKEIDGENKESTSQEIED